MRKAAGSLALPMVYGYTVDSRGLGVSDPPPPPAHRPAAPVRRTGVDLRDWNPNTLSAKDRTLLQPDQLGLQAGSAPVSRHSSHI